MEFQSMSKQELSELYKNLMAKYQNYQDQHLNLNMARGKPSTAQLDLSMEMLDLLNSKSNMKASSGEDCRNYGVADGLPEMRNLFADLLGMDDHNIIIGGNSSLNMMFDAISCCMTHGFQGCKPWSQQGHLKFLCPSPGYDRHFAITEYFGFELISIPMLSTGPDMDEVEKWVSSDPTVKGIWCVPKYSNPTGITYSDETVRRFAALKPSADDFHIFWDNAYCVHDLTDIPDHLLNLWLECRKLNSVDLPIFFASTSKITFPGAGVAAIAASEKNLEVFRKHFSYQTIGPDKLNQLRHIAFLKDIDHVKLHMKKHRAILQPKFEAVEAAFDKELAGKGIADWTHPNGGYFISLNVMEGCAKEVVSLCKKAGVILTNAGATFPYGKDPKDTNIRVAPSFPPIEELKTAADLLCLCVQIAACSKLLKSE